MLEGTEIRDPLERPKFDRKWYLEAYPDVAKLGMDPWEHYLTYGILLGRRPNGENIISKISPEKNSAAEEPVLNGDAISATEILIASHEVYQGTKLHTDLITLSNLPKVSVIMTAHNAADTIARAIESIVFQTWPNLELVIVDDASIDGTWEQISISKRKYPHLIRSVRLECNLGTYIAKNVGISESSGSIVMFQDSDDYSHPNRVTVQAAHLVENPSTQGNRTRYCRFDPSDGRLIKVSGYETKFGLITLAVRRNLFDEIGYFNPVRRAGDDEWFQRARALVGPQKFKNLDVALYMAELRSNSLAQDLLSGVGPEGITQVISGSRAEYNKLYVDLHARAKSNASNCQANNPPLPKVAASWIPNDLAAIPKWRLPIIATMCSIPARTTAMQSALKSVIDQVDRLYIYLDKYESVPEFIQNDDRIIVTRSQSVDFDFRDNAKFLPYNSLKSEFSEFHFFTLDDDIRYPKDYIARHLTVSRDFGDGCITGLHGVIYEEDPVRYFKRRLVSHFRKDALRGHSLVNCLGTGTTAFNSSCFPAIDPRRWQRGGMVDIYFSILAKLKNVPMVCMARTENWLADAETNAGGPTLFDEFKEKDALIVAELKKYCPWGYAEMSRLVDSLPLPKKTVFHNLLPAFAGQVSVNDGLQRYRG